jgi:hypothetical protein
MLALYSVRNSTMKKSLLYIILIMTSQQTLGSTHPACSNQKYIEYVERRLAFYEKNAKTRYQQSQETLKITPFESFSCTEQERYLYLNTISSARFGLQEEATENIEAYEDLKQRPDGCEENGDRKHITNIAKGWLAYRSGNKEATYKYLLEAADTETSPVLSSFGPDKTLIRELYKNGDKKVVLDYLQKIQSFWNDDDAMEYINTWEKMMKYNCAVQFHYYDIESAKKLRL